MLSKYALHCRCGTDYDSRSYHECPSCGATNQKVDYNSPNSRSIPELVEYEKNTAKHPVITGTKPKEKKMFNLWIKRKELELEIKKLTDELEYHKKQEEMRIAEAVQKQRLKSNEEVASIKIESVKAVKKAEIDSEMAINQVRAEFVKEKAELETKHIRELSMAEQEAAKGYYDKLSAALTDLHQNGDKNSKFVQELALEMIKKTPKMLPTQAEVHLTGDTKDVLDG